MSMPRFAAVTTTVDAQAQTRRGGAGERGGAWGQVTSTLRALGRRARMVAAGATVVLGLGMTSSEARAQTPLGGPSLAAGDIAIVGRINNISPDHFAIVTLAPIPTGTNIFFTDNGWQTSTFRTGEGVRRLQVTSAIERGRVIRSNDSSADFVWSTVSGDLNFVGAGDQLYAFQATSATLPLTTITRHVAVFDDTGAFETASDSSSGAVPPGLSIAGGTAVTLSGAATTTLISTASLASGTKAEWLTAISNTSTWGSGASLPSGARVVNPYTVISDTTAGGSAVNGVLFQDEYGPGNLYVFSGDGTGFGGTVGRRSFYFNSDDTNLYIAFQPGATLNDVVVLYFDTVSGGENDASMGDAQTADRNVISNLGSAGNDGFPFLADYALSIWNTGPAVDADAYLYDLNPGGNNSLTFIAGTGVAPIDAGTQPIVREYAIPLSAMGISAGAQIKFFAAYCAPSLFNSNETVPSIAAINSGANPGTSGTVTYDAFAVFNTYVACTPPGISTDPADATSCDGTSAAFSVTAAGAGLSYQWQIDALPIDGVFADISGETASTLTLSSPGDVYNGVQLRCVVTGTCGTATSAAATLTVNRVTGSSSGPSAVCDGATATFSVTATNSPSFQWQRATTGTPVGGTWTDVGGETGSTLSFAAAPGDSGFSYRCLVTYASPCTGFSVTPETGFPLIVNPATSIVADPTGGTVCEGDAFALTVTAGGTGPFSYQWFRGVTPVGSDSPTYSIGAATPADAGSYTVQVTGLCGSATSSAAALAVNLDPVITFQTSSFSVCDGEDFTMGVIATGAGLTYQWRKNGVDIPITDPAWGVSPASAADAGSYDCVITGTCGTITSSPIVVTVNEQPAITFQTGSQSLCDGDDLTMGVIATGAGLTYQWRKDGVEMPGVTDPAWGVSPVSAGDAGSYDCVITGACGTVTSSPIVVTINPPTAITAQPDSTTGFEGGSANFSVTATGAGLTYQWRKDSVDLVDGGNIAGATSATLTVSTLSAADEGSYDCVVGGDCGADVTSSPAGLDIDDGPECFDASEIAQLLASDGAADDQFGIRVAVAGDTAVAGAFGDDTLAGANAGSAYVFTRTAGVWTQQAKLTASDSATGDNFGISVAVAGDTVIVGAYSDDALRGSAYVFTRSGTVWTQQAKLTASDGAAGDRFGRSVVVEGDTTVVGAYGDDSFRGSAYVFTRSGTVWTQQAKITAADGAAGDRFGLSVAAAGDTAVVGAFFDDTLAGTDAGSMYVFTRSAGVWTQQAKLTASDGAAGDNFGDYVAVSADTAVAGAWQDDANTGSAYVFTRSAGVWTQQAKLIASDGAAGDNFGVSVAIVGDTAVVSSYADDTPSGVNSGSAYVFTRTAGAWTQQAKITAADGAANDLFGQCVAVAGNTAFIGASGDDSSKGSAYIFDLTSYAPTITDDPDALAVCDGSSASFSVAASGTGLTYQWRKDTVPLADGGAVSGATTATLTINPAVALDAGSYDCIVTSACGSATSAAAALTIDPVTSIASDPTGGTICPGAPFTFTVVAGGTGPFSYQWFRDATPVGADSPSYLIASATAGDTGSYTVQVTGLCGGATSTAVLLDVSDTVDPLVTLGSIDPCYASLALAEAAAIAATGASDNCGGAVLLSASTVGTCAATITVTGADAAGNSASVDYSTAIDATDPTLTCPADVTVSVVSAPANVSIPLATASDACTGSPTIINSFNAGGADASGLYPAGTTVVTFTATDECGNESTCTVNVTVGTCTPPTTTYVDDDYTGLPVGSTVTWPHVGGSGSYTIGCDAFATIQGGVGGVAATGQVNVAMGLYPEDVNVNKPGVSVVGAGAGSSVVEGVPGGDTATFRMAAADVAISGFTITRQGNTLAQWNDPTLNTAGVAVIGQANSGSGVSCCVITGNRTGVDINNANAITVQGCAIDFNRTGLLFRNVTDNGSITNNTITNNWTVGVLFLDLAPAPQSADATHIVDNAISGNWYADIQDRMTTADLKDFSRNWFGATAITISPANTAEPGYAALIPVAYGGSATNPGGAPNIAGAGSFNIDFTPYLAAATDTSPACGLQPDLSTLWMTARLAQTGFTNRTQEAHDATVPGGAINAEPGDYPGNLTVTKADITVTGPNAGLCTNSGTARAAEATLTPDIADGTLDTPLIYVTAPGLTIDGFTLDADNPALTSGQLVGAADSDADNLVANGSFDDPATYPFVHVRDVHLRNSILRAANDVAINLYNDGSFPVSDDNDISCNWIDNIQGLNTLSPLGPYNRIAVLLYNDTYAAVDTNDLTDVRIGVQTGNNFRANPPASTPASISTNTISSELAGIWHNLHYVDASGWTISNNTVTDSPVSAAHNYAVSITSIYGGAPVAISNNTLRDSRVGYYLWNTPTAPPITITGGSVIDCGFGVLATNVDPDFGPGGPTHQVLSGVSIINPTFIGILIEDVAASSTDRVRIDALNVMQTGSAGVAGALVVGPRAEFVSDDGSAFLDNTVGISVQNFARVRIEQTSLIGNLASAIDVSGGSIVDAGNCAASDITGLGASAGNNTLTGYGFDNADPFAVYNANPSAGPPVYAQNNAFGASLGDDIEHLLYDDTNLATSSAVLYSQAGALLVQCPGSITVQCASDIPAGITNEAAFEAAGAVVSASNYTVAFSDSGALTAGEGIITRTYTITSPCGDTAACMQSITVEDNTAPLISSCAPNQSAFADALCTATLPDFTTAVSASDNCGDHDVSQSPAAGSTIALGVTTVTITVDDGRGNAATCTASFTVTDNTPPTLSSCAPDAGAPADASCQAAVPDFTAATLFTDNCDPTLTVTQSPTTGTLVGPGTTEVTITAADDAGNSSFCTVNFTVTDSTPPAISSCPADAAAFADASCQAPVPDFTGLSVFTDNCDPSLAITQSPAAGTLVGLGTTEVTVTATDDAGNSTPCTITFTVSDNTPPTITTCAPPQTGAADALCQALVPDFTLATAAADNCSLASITQSPAAGTSAPLGTTTVIITATDGAGLTAACSTTFTVIDNTAPTISTCVPPITLAAGPACTAALPDLTALIIATDNCDSTLIVTQSPLPGAALPLGDTTITFTVTDDAGNVATCDATVTVAVPAITYVDRVAAGANDGSSWSNAYLDLQDALAAVACAGAGEIWVAQGTYRPDRATADRTHTFALLSNVSVYGGFNATETLLSQRDPDANITILSGDIGVPNTHSDNSFNVVTASGADPTAILDGFTVTRGNAGPSGTGAGLVMQKGSPTITRCLFTLNQAFRGGAVYAEDSAPAFIRCTFLANTATDGGGAIRSVTSAVDVVNGRFLGNTANIGAAVYNTANSDSTFTNCAFSGNAAATTGGAVYNTISSLVTLTNCSLTANTANQTGGVYTTGLATQVLAAGTILYGNTDSSGSTEQAQIRGASGGAVSADYCDIQNLVTAFGAGNISIDPQFTDAGGLDSTFGTLDDDLRPMPGSPAIDAGSNPALPADTYDLDADADTTEQLPLDLALATRRIDDPAASDTGLGSAPIVDMGAYEFDCTGVDCNQNGVCDSTDISLGGSTDCFDPAAPPIAGLHVNGLPDGIPDECQCVADWNRDGVVNSTDVSDFINTYFDDQLNSTANGDVNCNGVSNSTDVSDFINIWFEEQAGLRPWSNCTI